VQYILRFRNQEKLGGEAGYYLSSLVSHLREERKPAMMLSDRCQMGAVQFIENLDKTSLTISGEEFERNVEAAVSVIAEKHREEIPPIPPSRSSRGSNHPHISDKSGLSQPEVVPRSSLEVKYYTPRKTVSSQEPRANSSLGGDFVEENTAVSGLLRTIQRPLSSLGRIFSEDNSSMPSHQGPQGLYAPPGFPPRLSPAVFQPPRHSDDPGSPTEELRMVSQTYGDRTRKADAEDAAARQASAEAAEAQRIQRAEHQTVVESVRDIVYTD